MSTAPRLSRAEQRDATRRRVLDAARDAFARDGFHAASTDAICRAAGFTRGALYASWRTKEELFLAVFDRESAARFAGLEDLEGVAVAAAYERLLRDDDGWSAAVVEFTLHAARHPEVAAAFAERTAELRARLVARAVRAGLGDTAAERFVHTFLALGSGVLVERLANAGAFPEGVLPEVVGLLLDQPSRAT